MANPPPQVKPHQGENAAPVLAGKGSVYEQAALNLSESQAGTSYANSLFRYTSGDGSTIWDDDGAQSVYSYDTARDGKKFLKEVEGRVSTRSNRLQCILGLTFGLAVDL